MPGRLTTVERAFELARAGSCSNLSDLAKLLNREQYLGIEPQLSGPSLRNQLRTIMLRAHLERYERLARASEKSDH